MRYVAGRWFVLDVVHVQANPADVDRIVVNTAAQDGKACAVRWEIEGGASGKRDSQRLTAMLVGYDAQGVRPQGDKVLRAKPFAAQVKAKNVKLVAGRWTANYLDELASFPYGAHDDMVDATSGAFAYLTTGAAQRTPGSFQA
jgi:predicted phage terminase large subunit-like protein